MNIMSSIKLGGEGLLFFPPIYNSTLILKSLRIKRRLHLLYIQFIFPFSGDHGGDAVANQVG